MTVVKNGKLKVPGASLYYEMRGSGPIADDSRRQR